MLKISKYRNIEIILLHCKIKTFININNFIYRTKVKNFQPEIKTHSKETLFQLHLQTAPYKKKIK